MNRKLRFGMIGGGQGAFIGAVHRIAAQMDGKAELVAGAFSSSAERSEASGRALFLDPARVYGDYREMAEREAQRTEGRLDFVVIVTPNHEHFAPARLFLERGFNVVCDKPVTFDLAEARKLHRVVAKSGKLFVLTHNYSGNVMVRQARELVRRGKLGTVRKVVVEYFQGWLATRIESSGQKQASWRTDPRRSGAAGCMGDIGTHAAHLAGFVTGLQIDSLCADLTTFVSGRALDDDGSVLIRYRGGAKGVLQASQVSVGEENALTLRVYGTEAALSWRQEDPDQLIVKYPDRPAQIWRRGAGYVSDDMKRLTRTPAGHPEGYLEAFGNIYQETIEAIRGRLEGRRRGSSALPSIDDGVEGMQFIEAVIKSSRRGARWIRLS